jgi:hypothetical protein
MLTVFTGNDYHKVPRNCMASLGQGVELSCTIVPRRPAAGPFPASPPPPLRRHMKITATI